MLGQFWAKTNTIGSRIHLQNGVRSYFVKHFNLFIFDHYFYPFRTLLNHISHFCDSFEACRPDFCKNYENVKHVFLKQRVTTHKKTEKRFNYFLYAFQLIKCSSVVQTLTQYVKNCIYIKF